MMPTKTYELRNLYLQQSQYSAEVTEPQYQQLLQWPDKGYFEKFRPDSDLLQEALLRTFPTSSTVADQVFGNQKHQGYLDLKHSANLFYERCRLHKQHIEEIDRRHVDIQEKKFGVEINHGPDRAKRLSNLEGQLLQLEQQRRDEELAFWKDTVELRQRLFEGAAVYKDARHRFSLFSDVEGQYGG